MLRCSVIDVQLYASLIVEIYCHVDCRMSAEHVRGYVSVCRTRHRRIKFVRANTRILIGLAVNGSSNSSMHYSSSGISVSA